MSSEEGKVRESTRRVGRHAAQTVEGDSRGSVRSGDLPVSPARVIANLLAQVSDQVSRLVSGQIELAKVELVSKVTKLGVGGALLGVAGFLGIFFLVLLLHSCAYAFGALVNSVALGYLITAGIVLLVILVLVVVALVFLRRAKRHVATPAPGFKKSLQAVKKGVTK